MLQTGPASFQSVTITGGGTLLLQGGTGSFNEAHIENAGTVQTISFPAGGALMLTGGSGGGAAVRAPSGDLTITGGPNISLINGTIRTQAVWQP